MDSNDKTALTPSSGCEPLNVVRDQALLDATPVFPTRFARQCVDCRVANAFHAWNEQHLTPSYNWMIDFRGWGIPPLGKRAVIEQITATISVPSGEWARLRLFTSLGPIPSNLDLTLTSQGQIAGTQILVATHSVRIYSDHMIEFNVSRDNALTEGTALICISGFLIDL